MLVSIDLALTNAIVNISCKYNKKYCYVTLNKLQEILARHYNIHRSIRTIQRHLKKMVESGIIGRKRQYKKTPSGQIINLPNVYWLEEKAYRIYGSLLKTIKKLKKSFTDMTTLLPNNPLRERNIENNNKQLKQQSKNNYFEKLKQLFTPIRENNLQQKGLTSIGDIFKGFKDLSSSIKKESQHTKTGDSLEKYVKYLNRTKRWS